jgi:hypothetical protein
MNFEKLPVTCLTKIAQLLNTQDLLNLFSAIYECSLNKPDDFTKFNLFNLIFNTKYTSYYFCYRSKNKTHKFLF